ncbi:hypothetical protein F4819DRAFT_254343 [Hypoxylon fuscum]|nr:hypothetical protein F4819DRAFT_254343 [Hypoxylon fuscum]
MDVLIASTTFSPAPSCTQDIYYVPVPDLSCVKGTSAILCRYYHLGPITSTSDCFPTSWSPSSGAYISPGACPRGYTIACAYTAQPEKTATCCPSGFGCQTLSEGFPWYTTDLCTQPMADTLTYVYTTRTPGKDFETSTVTGGGAENAGGAINAFGVEIRWQPSDLTTTAPTSSLSFASSTPASSLTITTSSSFPTITAPVNTGLTTGTQVGIGIGTVALFFLLLAIAFLIWRRRRNKRQTGTAPNIAQGENFRQAKLTAEALGNGRQRDTGRVTTWLYQTERYELPHWREPVEID